MAFLNFVQASLPIVAFLIPLIMAMVQYLGKLGISGKRQLLASMASGLVLGVMALIAELGLPPDFAYWFGYIVVGLVCGLSASGVYEAVKHATKKGMDAWEDDDEDDE